jgi:hypothetical protein
MTTIYSIKKSKRETFKTTKLHEAREVAKQLLVDKAIAAKKRAEFYNRNNPMPYHPYISAVSEQMYVRHKEVEYCFYITIGERCGANKTYRATIKVETVGDGGYNFALHAEIANRVAELEKLNETEGAD